MADPVNKGKHPLHDYRYVVTSDAEVEFSPQMPKDWGMSKGAIVCEMTDCQNQKDLAILFSEAPETKDQLDKLRSLVSKAKAQCEIFRGIQEMQDVYNILDQ